MLGGVPHDIYGMTSLSIRQYVFGIYKQLGLREKKDITKVQTGGPGQSMFYSRISLRLIIVIHDFLLQMATLARVSDFCLMILIVEKGC